MSTEREAARETTILALLAYRPGGWSGGQLHDHVGGSIGRMYEALESLEQSGRIRAWWVDGPKPRTRLYGLAEGGRISTDHPALVELLRLIDDSASCENCGRDVLDGGERREIDVLARGVFEAGQRAGWRRANDAIFAPKSRDLHIRYDDGMSKEGHG